MLEKLTEDELSFCECLYNPLCLGETLFSDFDNLAFFDEEKFGHIRLGQLPLLSYEYLIDDDPELTAKENFQLRKCAGEIYCLGGRLFGKTLFVEKIDLAISIVLNDGERCGFSSYDVIHIKGVLEDVIQALDYHPFYKLFEAHVGRHPNYRISFKNGYLLEGINMNLSGKSPGSQFFQKHLSRLYIEEASFETEQVYNKRMHSISEYGCIFRISGMTSFTKHSPCGKVFYDRSLKSWLVNLPQYINPNWGEREKNRAVKKFGGEQSIGYRVFVKGEIVGEAVSTFDMDRIKFLEKKQVKNFEITKQNFDHFESIIIVERPTNADNCFIAADVGEDAPTEIGIFFEINKKYRYVYNITAYNLTDKQQKKLFRWLTIQVNANYIAPDATEQLGRAIYRDLEEAFSKEHLVWVSFNEKMAIDYERNEHGHIIYKKGKPLIIEEHVFTWSVKVLKDLLYENKLEIPLDYKFENQISSVVTLVSGNKITYHCSCSDDHLFQMFQVLAIMIWEMEFKATKAIVQREYFKGGV